MSAPRAGLLTVAALCTLQPPGYLTQAARSTPAVAWLLSKYIYTNIHHAVFTSRTTITIIKGFLCQVINITPQLNPFSPLRVRMCGTNGPCIYSIYNIYNIYSIQVRVCP